MIKGGFDTLNSILKPFLNCVRIPKFKNREDSRYKNYPSEENMTIYLSSAWLGDDWSYDLYKEHREKMLSGEDWFTCNLPYQLSAYHGLLTKKRIEETVFMAMGDYIKPIDKLDLSTKFGKNNSRSNAHIEALRSGRIGWIGRDKQGMSNQ